MKHHRIGLVIVFAKIFYGYQLFILVLNQFHLRVTGREVDLGRE